MAGPVNNHNQRHIWNEEEEHQLLLARATFPHRRDWIRIRQDPRFNGLFGQMTVDALRSKHRRLVLQGAAAPIVNNVELAVHPLPQHFWTVEENNRLVEARELYPGRNQWRRIQQDAEFAPLFGAMTIDALRSRYRLLIAGEDDESSDEELNGVFMDEHDEDAGVLADPDYNPDMDENFSDGGSNSSSSSSST